MKKLLVWCSLVVAGWLTVSCETEVDLLAPYKASPVVYSIINPADEYHYVKITKTFLGEGDARDFAQVADSSIIPNLNAVVTEYVNGTVKRSWNLRDTVIEGKEEGIFYTDNNVVYYFRADDLTPGNTLELSFEIDGKKVSTEAEILPSPNVTRPSNAASFVTFVTGDVFGVWNYEEVRISFYGVEGGDTYEVRAEMMYKETYADGNSVEKSVPITVARGLTSTSLSAELSTKLEGRDLFSVIQNSVEPDVNVVQREILDFKITVSAMSEDMATYLSVNTPSTGISQERPEFTNVTLEDGEAFGMFTVMGSYDFIRPLSVSTQKGIAGLEEMRSLQFCSSHPALVNEPSVYCQ